MAELNLKQIADKLNAEFTGSGRKLIFWYDDNAEFAEDIDTLELENAKVLHLAPDNQFYTKYFLECEDKGNNYLVYAPFAKPAIRDNHLADTIRYSKEFFADRASLLTIDLGIDERYKPVIQHYIKFFGNKQRTQAFYDLAPDALNKNTIEIALMSVLCKNKTASFEDVVRTVFTGAEFEDNPCLEEFRKYDLIESFWNDVQDVFGYADEQPTLEKLAMSMFVTYMSKTINSDLPSTWQPYISFKSGSVIAFLDNLMNSVIYGERFDQISEHVFSSLHADAELQKLPIESLTTCCVFSGIDQLLIAWAIGRLEIEDISAKLGELDIPELCRKRRLMHYGKRYRSEYFVVENAFALLSDTQYASSGTLNELAKNYTDSLYQMDRRYRYFCFHLDKLEECAAFDNLKELVENVYANDYLSKVCANWGSLFAEQASTLQMMKQVDFFRRYVSSAKDQLVVIISDALRYEVGMTLLEKLQADEKCNATMNTMASTLPSITKYDMAALLPYKNYELTDDYDVLIDGLKTESLEQRQTILQKTKQASRCVQYDDIKGMSQADLRAVFTRQDVVYIYHNQVDARGDKLSTENEVFNACEEAVEEITALIKRLTTSANRSHFLITADHGFLYRRNKLTESDKISSVSGNASVLGRRYLMADKAVEKEGVGSVSLGTMMGNQEERTVFYPIGADIFKAPGSGVNYVHGGCSPQEMIVPLIEVKTERGFKETSTAQIALVSLLPKITNLITSLDFVQSEAVSDVIKETTYHIYFVDDKGEKISNEHLYKADKKDSDSIKRVFRLRFSFKNKKYDRCQKYYLIAFDDKTGLETLRHEVVMDMAFADDFGF